MRIGYTDRARRDIEAIATYLRPRSPRGAERVGASIRRSIERLAAHPLAGRLQDHPEQLRKLVVPGFGYLVYYKVEMDADVLILTIRHPARKRLYEDR